MSYTTEAMADHTLSLELYNKIRDNSTACVQVLPQQFLKPGENHSADLIATVRHMMANAIDIMTRWIIEGEDSFTKSYNKKIMMMYNLVVAMSCFATNLHCEVDEHKYSALEIILLFTDFGSSRSDFWKGVIRRSCLEVVYPKYQFDIYFNDEFPYYKNHFDYYIEMIQCKNSNTIPTYFNQKPEPNSVNRAIANRLESLSEDANDRITMRDLDQKIVELIDPISDTEPVYHAQLDMSVSEIDMIVADRFDDQIDAPAMSIEDAKRIVKNIEGRMKIS